MYAIVFDMDTDAMKEAYQGNSWQNGYGEIGNVLAGHGFKRKQGSTYFGPDADAVSTVLAVQDVKRQLDWFASSVRDIRMLRIEEDNDLMPAVRGNLAG